MRIALVSYEYAGTAKSGGIGTYVRNAAQMLADRGHDIEVFTGAAPHGMAGVSVHARNSTKTNFSTAILPTFAARHAAAPFDVVEAPEFGADLAAIAAHFPNVPRVIKLHTATYQIDRINDAYVTHAAKARFILGALRRGQAPKPYWARYDCEHDPERALALTAHEVVSPSHALLDMTAPDWGLDRSRASVVPNAFSAPACASRPRTSDVVTFVGRLEVRKGVLELAQAIPIVLKAYPSTRFRFVGACLPHPATRKPLDGIIRKIAGERAARQIEFTGALPYDQLADILADAALIVTPSYWEAFGYVCLEAMAAGCAVIGSNAGGMADIIEDGRTGLLVPPRNPSAIARAIISLLNDAPGRAALGAAARTHVLQTYAPEAIAPLQEASYARAIARARAGAAKAPQPAFQ